MVDKLSVLKQEIQLVNSDLKGVNSKLDEQKLLRKKKYESELEILEELIKDVLCETAQRVEDECFSLNDIDLDETCQVKVYLDTSGDDDEREKEEESSEQGGIGGPGSVSLVSTGVQVTILTLKYGNRVKDVVEEACMVWAQNPKRVLASVNGAIVSGNCSLRDIDASKSSGEVTKIKLKPLRYVARNRNEDGVLKDGDDEADETERILKQIDATKRMASLKLSVGIDSAEDAYEAGDELVRNSVLYTLSLLLFCFGYVKPHSDKQRGIIYNNLESQVFQSNAGGVMQLAQIRTRLDLEIWLQTVLPNYLVGHVMNQVAVQKNITSRHWMLDNSLTELIGVVRLRQLRVRANVTCSVPKQVEQVFSACFNDFSLQNNAVDSFGTENVLFGPGFEYWGEPAVQAHSETDLTQIFTTEGKYASYPSSGYILDVGHDFRETNKLIDLVDDFQSSMDRLVNNSWITTSTAAVIIEYNTYVGGKDLYKSSTILFEQRLAGEFVSSVHHYSFGDSFVIPPTSSAAVSQILLGVVMGIILIQRMFHLRYYWVIKENALLFLLNFHQTLDVIIIGLYCAVIAMQYSVQRYAKKIHSIAWEKQHTFISFRGVEDESRSLNVLCGTLSVFLFLRLILQLRYFKSGAVVLSAVFQGMQSILLLLLIFSPAIIAICIIIWQLTGGFSERTQTFSQTIVQFTIQLFAYYEQSQSPNLHYSTADVLYGWYVAVAVGFAYLLMRVLFPAYAGAFMIHAFLSSISRHKKTSKRIAKMRSEYLSKVKKHSDTQNPFDEDQNHNLFTALKKHIVDFFNIKKALKLEEKKKGASSKTKIVQLDYKNMDEETRF